jgi:radical SAM superfamily enzyme YgiQ (UPF0313 family)
MRVLLVNPHVPLEIVYGKGGAKVGAVLPPLGILYMASYLRVNGRHAAEVLDANVLRMGAGAVAGHCADTRPGCIGFSATTLAYPYAVDAARLVREKCPSVKILIGGAHAQSDPEGILAENPGLFDFVCHGEGELALEMLLDHLESGRPPERLAGWAFADGGRVVSAPPAPIPEDLDMFGHPAEIVPPEWVPHYHEKVLACRKRPMFTMMSSRGCPYRCAFCSTPAKFRTMYQGRMRFHSIDWVIRELEILEKRLGVREVNFVDDTFNVDRRRVMAFADRMRESGIAIEWACNFEAHVADRELMAAIRKAGCWSIMIGGESGSDAMLKSIRKGVTTDQLLKVARWAHEEHVVSRFSFIIGLPGETAGTIAETVDLVRKSDIHFPYFQLYVPLPGSALYDQLEAKGTIIVKNPRERSASRVNYLPAGLSERQLADAYHGAFRATYFRWRMIRNHLRFLRSPADILRYWRGFRALLRFS